MMKKHMPMCAPLHALFCLIVSFRVAVEKEVTVEPPEVEDTVSETDTMQKVEAIFDVSKDEEDLKRVQAQENKQKTRPKFRPYKGKLKSAGVKKMVESLEETEMKMMYDEMAASRPGSDEMPSTLLNMPASCTSILKVRSELLGFKYSMQHAQFSLNHYTESRHAQNVLSFCINLTTILVTLQHRLTLSKPSFVKEYKKFILG